MALECQIRAHLNQKDTRNRKPALYDPRLDEAQIRQFCCSKLYKEKCPVLRRFIEETDSIIVKRELPQSSSAVLHLKIETPQRETLEPVKLPPKDLPGDVDSP